jgi:mRNA-degrading endonuclease RelE of RelBE toxin-antitoxin system
MNSRTTRRFRELLAALPAHVRRQAQEAYRIFQQNPAHPGLHFKQVHPDPPIYSARVGIGYRAVGTLDDGTIVWFWIGSHADYDKLLDQL